MSHRPGTGFLLAWIIALLSLHPVWAEAAIPPEPSQVSAQLVFDAAEYYLGENVLAHYGITNTGTQDIKIDTGSDYRGSPRALRFKVTAVDVKGHTVADPYRGIMCMGGLGGSSTLKPGETFWASLALLQYCDFTIPGTYTIQVYHDLGWGARTPASPVAVGKLTLRLPTARQAAAIIDRMAALPENTGGTLGGRRTPYADFTVLRYPIYLPSLRACAQGGDIRAVDGIASIRTPQATRALMTLSGSTDQQIADRALAALLLRLPKAEKSTHRDYNTRLRGLFEWSWSGHLAPDVLNIGWRLLAETDRQHLIYGAEIIERQGRPTDLPRLLTIFDHVLIAMKDDPVEQRDYLRPATACDALVTAVDALIARGGTVPAVHTAAQGIALLCAVKRNPGYRPAGWQSTAQTYLTHPIPFVRATALEKLPLPLDPAFIDQVSQLIHDPFIATQGAALDVAAQTQVDRFGEDALQVLVAATNEWIVRSAFQTANACGIPRDRVLETCINRFEEPGMTAILFEQIISSVFIHEGGYGSSGTITVDEARRLKTRWQAFLAENHAVLHAGKAFPIATPPLAEDLLPAGYQFYRKDGSTWPARQIDR